MQKENDSASDAHYLQKVVSLIHIARLSSESKHHVSNDNPSLKLEESQRKIFQ